MGHNSVSLYKETHMIISKELCSQLDTEDLWMEIFSRFEREQREDHANTNLFDEIKRRLQFAEDNGVLEQ